ncbi:putative hydroxyacylglutathione hydrolase [Babesia bovis T2Bo]|uniref:hydroxyacylglutathione hydrolase n=1 Tax=Babesia bovis TaxID=5865 RepID=A7AQJ8_BABBO|nr:putative hydroxyacylglutathione hydrolase [Babesia bovis T2Bo]EDO06817.1 putative hydroxyacylglutathione hydrolase [Babesia bovis T2Bo]BAN64942.1 hydroxyacylglutathione hydrolase, putative [Babesia bovis]|eukprot:XP_001610385.1 hydroxyacylglutathione hydrolase [Babesia bovis T2Bo]
MRPRIFGTLLAYCFLERTPLLRLPHSLIISSGFVNASSLIAPASPRRFYSSISKITMYQDIIKKPCAEVITVPLFQDNYGYIVVDPDGKHAFCVDPAEPRKILSVIDERKLTLKAVFCTHKHHDHSGGNLEMARIIPGIPVYGSNNEDMAGMTNGIMDGDVVRLGGLEIKGVRVPCHTLGHMLYYVTNPSDPTMQPLMFTGDTIFIGGCGRFFEGTADMMLNIMNTVRQYRKDSLIYCGHEYTVKNLKFASTVDDSPAVKRKMEWAESARQQNLPTVPSTLGEELEYNPFMRTATLMDKVGETTEVGAMRKLRQMKDRF